MNEYLSKDDETLRRHQMIVDHAAKSVPDLLAEAKLEAWHIVDTMNAAKKINDNMRDLLDIALDTIEDRIKQAADQIKVLEVEKAHCTAMRHENCRARERIASGRGLLSDQLLLFEVAQQKLHDAAQPAATNPGPARRKWKHLRQQRTASESQKPTPHQNER
jgi:hypothetical protein